MRLLVDTHVALWAVSDVPRLSPAARAAIAERENEVLISVVTLWEIAIKSAIGKFDASDDIREEFAHRGFGELVITGDHAWAVAELPLHHRDPFDRLLIAQAKLEKLVLVSADDRLRPYGVPIIW